jgi:hypothetical protein
MTITIPAVINGDMTINLERAIEAEEKLAALKESKS